MQVTLQFSDNALEYIVEIHTEIRANWQVDDNQAVDNHTWHQGRHTVTKPLASWANELLPIDVDIDASEKVVSLGL